MADDTVANNSIDIPESLEKYRETIEKIAEKFEKMIAVTEDGFQGQDIMVFITEISGVFVKVKRVVDDIKDIDGSDRLTIYNIIVAAIVEKSIMSSDKLTDDQKETIQAYFGENGLVSSLLEKFKDAYNDLLEKIDTNDDGFVTKAEFETYWREKCHCCGNTGCQDSCVKSCMSCCFPMLSSGKDTIEIDK